MQSKQFENMPPNGVIMLMKMEIGTMLKVKILTIKWFHLENAKISPIFRSTCKTPRTHRRNRWSRGLFWMCPLSQGSSSWWWTRQWRCWSTGQELHRLFWLLNRSFKYFRLNLISNKTKFEFFLTIYCIKSFTVPRKSLNDFDPNCL